MCVSRQFAGIILFTRKELNMYSIVKTAIVRGMDSVFVGVEADVSEGLPVFEMVGFLSSEVKEAKERVRTALRNSGYRLPVKRITINLSPAGVRKTGSGFDLPIAIAVLAALGEVPQENLRDSLVLGEIGLQGNVSPIRGVLPIVASAAGEGIKRCIIPLENIEEAKLIPGMEIWGISHISQGVDYLKGCLLYTSAGFFLPFLTDFFCEPHFFLDFPQSLIGIILGLFIVIFNHRIDISFVCHKLFVLLLQGGKAFRHCLPRRHLKVSVSLSCKVFFDFSMAFPCDTTVDFHEIADTGLFLGCVTHFAAGIRHCPLEFPDNDVFVIQEINGCIGIFV